MTRTFLACVIFSGIVVACGGNDNNNNSVCGDGNVTGTEQCDDGNTVSGDGCSSTCHTETASSCGNGTVEVDKGEQCDDGNIVDGDGCSSTCQNEIVNKCGNGHLDGSETCDDGNGASNDGCSSACAVEAGYSCSGTPSVCVLSNGSCAAPFVVALTDNGGTLEGMGSGDTTASTDQVPHADCSGYDSGAANDHIWTFTIPDTRDVAVTITGASTVFDSVLRVTRTACDLSTAVSETYEPATCSDFGLSGDDEYLLFSALPAGTYYIVVDGYGTSDVGTYSFSVSAAPTTCGDGTVDADEGCDDANAATPGCDARCGVAAGYACTGTGPSVCVLACGNGALDPGEECDDGATANGDRCSSTCTLEYDTAEVEPNDTVAQALTASHHVIKGSLTAGDVDLYTFTLAVPSTVELETYTLMDPGTTYSGVGTLTNVDCSGADTQLRVFNAAGDVTMNTTELAFDDDDGAGLCSYLGPNDSNDPNNETTTMVTDPTQGVLPAGTYTIKVNHYSATGTAARYLLDLKITSVTPTAPVAGDLVLNEFMAADNTSDTNCDGATTSTNDEFVELVNMSNKVLDLTGVTIADGVQVRHTFAAGATGSMLLNPGKAVVVWSGGAPACAGVTDWFVASTGLLSLNDAGDTITVKNLAGDTLINYVYPAATANKSFNLDPDARMLGTAYSLHDAITGAVGAYSPGKHADGTAF